MAFSLDTMTTCKLAACNVRSERHGEELVPAVDLKFSIEASNDILSEFDGHLKGALYHRSTLRADGTQPGLEGIEPVSDLPNLRFPKLGLPLKWDWEGTGYETRLDFGLGGKSTLVLVDCSVGKVTFEPKEGGTVLLGLTVQCAADLQEKTLGKLATLVQHDVDITLKAPEPAADKALA